MTNSWTDIANSTLVIAWGANPAENHPACMAHINRAKTANQVLPNGDISAKPAAKMIVIDPRKTRTATQADMYVRIRPGTDIAFQNGLIRYIINNIADGAAATEKYKTHFDAFLNQKQAQTFIPDGAKGGVATAADRSKYTDARLKLNSVGSDYQRYNKAAATGYAANTPTVVFDAAETDAAKKYKMWYVSAVGAETNIQFATSKDGNTWTAGVDTNVSDGADAPFVWLESGVYYMVNNDTDRKLTIRSSADGLTWGAETVILDPVTTAVTDRAGMAIYKYDRPMVLKDGATYRLYFQGRGNPAAEYKLYQGFTTNLPSAWNATTFNASFEAVALGPVPALSPAATGWDSYRVMHPMVVKNGAVYQLLYVGYSLTDQIQKISTATSADGLTFTRPVVAAGLTGYIKGLPGVTASSGTARPAVAQVGTSWALWYSDSLANLYFGMGWWDAAFQFTALPVAANDITDADSVFQKLKAQVAPYDEATVADICGCTPAELVAVAEEMIKHSRMASYTGAGDADPLTGLVKTPYASGYRATTILYAMGITQHTCGSQNVKGFANLQTILGNVGRAGGGINALRGIHNVQGSTDMGLLFGNIPAYSGNPTLMSAGHSDSTKNDANAFGKYMDGLWGNRMNMGTNPYDDAFTRSTWGLVGTGPLNLQSKGFYNMTMRWFAPNYAAGADDYVDDVATAAIADRRTKVNAVYDLWPKGNGDDHISMFRKMVAGGTKAAFILGQNPAVTEPNQGVVRDGLKNLDLLVVQDVFETETAAIPRKNGAVTYLIPAAAHVEQAGSATNSGRVLQWRYQAKLPSGNSKTDLELLLRLAKKLDEKGVFSHIENKWTTAKASGGLGWTKGAAFAASTDGATPGIFVSVYDSLFGRQYGWTPNAIATVDDFKDATESGFTHEGGIKTGAMTGAEYVAEKLYRQMCTVVSNAGGGTIWIYHEAFQSAYGTSRLGALYTAWTVMNRSKSRSQEDPYKSYGFHKWGYSWLVNRRVLYNNNAAVDATAEVPGDQLDGFQGPDRVSRLFSTLSTDLMDYANNNYRKHHNLKDLPSVGGSTAPHVLTGRFPGHTEPYETPEPALALTWGKNGTNGTSANLITTSDARSPIGTVDTYPLMLTTIRCVEHFQGGPITRNNAYNHELEPEPWIELNSIDARAHGIQDGDLVQIITKRTEGLADQKLLPYGAGWRAKVGVGQSTNQRVGVGVVAIPWHWGEKGLSTGSRANDLTIDAWDANTLIPEYKICLCRIKKM